MWKKLARLAQSNPPRVPTPSPERFASWVARAILITQRATCLGGAGARKVTGPPSVSRRLSSTRSSKPAQAQTFRKCEMLAGKISPTAEEIP